MGLHEAWDSEVLFRANAMDLPQHLEPLELALSVSSVFSAFPESSDKPAPKKPVSQNVQVPTLRHVM